MQIQLLHTRCSAGSVFNEEPLTLHLRLSTSLLCEPEHVPSQEERQAALCHILDQAETLQSPGGKGQLFPALERAKARWAAVIHDLATHRVSHQIQS